jgi:hypothetical protein
MLSLTALGLLWGCGFSTGYGPEESGPEAGMKSLWQIFF